MPNLKRVNLGTNVTAVAIACGKTHTCVIKNNATVKCWGDNTASQLGSKYYTTPLMMLIITTNRVKLINPASHLELQFLALALKVKRLKQRKKNFEVADGGFFNTWKKEKEEKSILRSNN